MKEADIQRDYYTATAANYDVLHGAETPQLALAFMGAAIETLGVRSVLDVGSGTGRVVQYLSSLQVDAVGIEPVAALRAVGHRNGIPAHRLIDGDATHLPYPDRSVDLVCAFSVLHHIPKPRLAVLEMLRTARKGVFILDANNFGQGRAAFAKQALHAVGLWPLANWIKTRGRGYTITEGDGLAYSYSVFSDHEVIRKHCQRIHVMNLDGSGRSMYRKAGVVALLGVM